MKFRSANPHRLATAAVQGQTALRPLFWLAMTLSCLATAAKAHRPALAIPALPYIHAARGCTQEDAPALEIYFTPTAYSGINDPTPPYLRLEISASPTETLTDLRLRLLPLRLDAARKPGRIARAEWVASGQNSTFLSGTLTLTLVVPGAGIQGRYRITAPNGQSFTSTFQTLYPTKASVCG